MAAGEPLKRYSHDDDGRCIRRRYSAFDLDRWPSPFPIMGNLLSVNRESGFEIMSRAGGTNGCLVGGPPKRTTADELREGKTTQTLDSADSLMDV